MLIGSIGLSEGKCNTKEWFRKYFLTGCSESPYVKEDIMVLVSGSKEEIGGLGAAIIGLLFKVSQKAIAFR